MPPIKLYGPPASSYVRTARLVCLEKSVPHVLEPIELGSDAHGERHPWHRVPVLEHGDVRLYETSAIARYVDEIGEGPSLVPARPPERAAMEQWISAINSYVYDAVVRNYVLVYVRSMLSKQPLDTDAVRAGAPKMERDLGRLDAAYAKRPWLAGEALSLADLFVAPIVATTAMFDEGRAALAGLPHLRRALEQLASRPSFATVHANLFA
ncbi:MAG: glutathione S-transferase family protein [Deltaproteobacteria bacterium]|nr:glutathione S-transferase family protein [Deltaproteobacteria bacterium]